MWCSPPNDDRGVPLPAEPPSFRNSGPIRHDCFVFPRTAVLIQHENARAFVADPTVVTLYNRRQQYERRRVCANGDRCDWFAVAQDRGALLKTYTCRTPGDTFGVDAVGIGDVDGDGTIDFLITSAWSGVHGFHSGRMFIISSGISRR